ncbi:MAG: hypothetical protein CR963_00980 [Gammaproteobacteria bacterium]|nr:MAG: hypothetical protein CR963_00980 [Gammaproteobacteria bacterium]
MHVRLLPAGQLTDKQGTMMKSSLEQAAFDAADILLEGQDLTTIPSLGIYQAILDEAKRGMLRRVMRATRGNQSHAAALMGINRTTLRTLLRRFGML